jgi:YHS domain-containing protein
MYLREIGFRAPCAVRSDAPARIAPECRVQVNHDLFFVSREDYVKKIKKNPLKYCKRLTDPVTREVFAPSKKSPRIDFEERAYFFSSDSTRAVFASNPSMYSYPPETMARRTPADSTAARSDSTAVHKEEHETKEAGSRG